jgi:hypothetical protein
VIDFCKGKPIGVEAATQMMMAAFESTYSRPLTQLEARDIMHTFVAMEAAEEGTPKRKEGSSKTQKRKAIAEPSSTETNYPEIFVNGSNVPPEVIDKFAREAIAQIGDEITSFVSSAWGQSAAKFHPIIGVGGGIHYFYKHLKKRIPHLTRPTDDPVYANARGYARTAQHLLEKKQQKVKV